MSRSVDSLIATVRSRVNRLLHDQVIEHTIVVMRDLHSALNQLDSLVRSDIGSLSAGQQEELKNILLPLTSESIREALHKNELHITNGIIRSKNRILTALSAEIPEGHEEIDPRDFPHYNW